MRVNCSRTDHSLNGYSTILSGPLRIPVVKITYALTKRHNVLRLSSVKNLGQFLMHHLLSFVSCLFELSAEVGEECVQALVNLDVLRNYGESCK